jgi:hypothetical protein
MYRNRNQLQWAMSNPRPSVDSVDLRPRFHLLAIDRPGRADSSCPPKIPSPVTATRPRRILILWTFTRTPIRDHTSTCRLWICLLSKDLQIVWMCLIYSSSWRSRNQLLATHPIPHGYHLFTTFQSHAKGPSSLESANQAIHQHGTPVYDDANLRKQTTPGARQRDFHGGWGIKRTPCRMPKIFNLENIRSWACIVLIPSVHPALPTHCTYCHDLLKSTSSWNRVLQVAARKSGQPLSGSAGSAHRTFKQQLAYLTAKIARQRYRVIRIHLAISWSSRQWVTAMGTDLAREKGNSSWIYSLHMNKRYQHFEIQWLNLKQIGPMIFGSMTSNDHILPTCFPFDRWKSWSHHEHIWCFRALKHDALA